MANERLQGEEQFHLKNYLLDSFVYFLLITLFIFAGFQMYNLRC